MVEHYSHKIQNVIQKELFKAQESIKIAVAWFTNDLLFQPLLLKLETGVAVELVLNKDEINDSDENDIDFKSFVEAGGALHWNMSQKLMHEKFCIIDNSTVIYGSYNWTNKAEYNDESIAVSKEEESTLEFYKKQFEKLCNIYPAETCERAIVHSRFDPFGFDKGEMVLDLFNVLVYRWIVNEKYVYRIFSKETKKQICLYDFEDILIHSNSSVSTIGVKRRDTWLFYSLKEKKLGEKQYSKINFIKQDTRFWIWQKKLIGVADENGTEVLPCEYEHLTVYNNSPYIILEKYYGGQGIAYNGVDLLGCCMFEDIIRIGIHRFQMKLKDKYGVCEFKGVNLEECWIIDFDYDEIQSIQDDYFIVKQGNTYGVSKPSNLEIECVFDEISYLGKERFIVSKSGKKGLYANGKLVIPCIYDELQPDGYHVSVKNGLKGVLTDNGKLIVDFRFTHICSFNFQDEPYNNGSFFLAYYEPYYEIWVDGCKKGRILENDFMLQKYIPEFTLFDKNEDPLLEELRYAIVRTIYEQIGLPPKTTKTNTIPIGVGRVAEIKEDVPKTRMVHVVNDYCKLDDSRLDWLHFQYTKEKWRPNGVHRTDGHYETFLLEKIEPSVIDSTKQRYQQEDVIIVPKVPPVIIDTYGAYKRCYIIGKKYSPSTNLTSYAIFNPRDLRKKVICINQQTSKRETVFPKGSAVELCKDVDGAVSMMDLLTKHGTKDCKICISDVTEFVQRDYNTHEFVPVYVYTYDLLL